MKKKVLLLLAALSGSVANAQLSELEVVNETGCDVRVHVEPVASCSSTGISRWTSFLVAANSSYTYYPPVGTIIREAEIRKTQGATTWVINQYDCSNGWGFSNTPVSMNWSCLPGSQYGIDNWIGSGGEYVRLYEEFSVGE
ncbi:MAG TPA: hypothetical protein VGE21_03680 [Flavobacteriales bacterium]